jgi:hypothetical protein
MAHCPDCGNPYDSPFRNDDGIDRCEDCAVAYFIKKITVSGTKSFIGGLNGAVDEIQDKDGVVVAPTRFWR